MTTSFANFASLVGADQVRELDGAIEVAPATVDEVAAVLRMAQEQHCVVVPRGGGTKQGWGYPVAPGVVLAMHRLQAVREHTWQDMTCSVEAGCAWSSLEHVLAQHGQNVALDPLWPQQATVGGVVATNDSGALRLRYGGLRDLIIGMTIVLADGTVAHTGGKVVKNVAGYDLHKLMIGAFGTLAVICSVNFRLHSIPQSRQSLTVNSDTVEPLSRLLLALLHGQLSVEALQIRGGAHGFALDVQLASLAEVVRTQSATLALLSEREGLCAVSAGHEVWATRAQIFSGEVTCKATMLPTEIARFAQRVQGLGGESVTYGTGIMTACFPAAAVEQIAGFRRELEGAGGSLIVLKQEVGMGLDCWGALPDSVPLMREIKGRFDSAKILNRGRFLGGI